MDLSQYVSKLNQMSQNKGVNPPEYRDLGSSGPDHMKIFKQQVYFDGKLYPAAEGNPKRNAKQKAAKNAYEVLRREQQEPAAAASTSAEPLGQDLNHVSNGTGDFNKLCEKTSEVNISLQKSTTNVTDFMSKVNLYCQKTRRELCLIEETPEAQSQMPFAYRMKIDKVCYPMGTGRNKQEAKQKAAQLAWSALQQQTNADSEVSVRSTESWDDQSRITPTSSTASNCQESSDDVAQPNSGSNSIQFKDSPVQHNSSAQSPVMEKSTKKEVTTKTSRFTSEYDNIEPLGDGSYGHVYKARKIEMETYCAIKEIKISNKLPGEKEKSLLEVKALYTLFHENIVRYYTSWFEDTGYRQVVKPNVQYLFIEMELCDGGTLKSWIDKKNNDPKESSRQQESLELAGQILNAVEYIHNKNLIHRDLKPENILFGGDGKVRIGDFGLVTSDSNDGEVVERTEARGTKSYMAPEQFGTKYDRKVDIFALGLIFFELFLRISTYHERRGIWNDVRNQNFPKDFTEIFPVESRIIKTMLNKKPEDRPEASALKSELEKWTQKEEIQLRTI